MDPIAWLAFAGLIGLFLALDLGVLHREAHVVPPREALRWTALWVGLAGAFGLFVGWWRGGEASLTWFTGYLIEYSLSVDNVFVFALVFGAFAVPPRFQHRVLFWGVLGALAMRLVLIVLGASLVARYDWILLLFGAFLVVTGLRMARGGDEPGDPEANPTVRFARRHLRATSELHGQRFIVATAAGRRATPLLLALIALEASDLIFAADSIPAIFGLTTDPFIVFTSNAFAILGLRSLYFLLADARERFRYLPLGLAAVLIFVGVKMLLGGLVHISPLASLMVIAVILGLAVGASLRRDGRHGREGRPLGEPR
ncbi:MAG TPA: TerC family protein [Candidatus Limnocylindrales bacterium]|nr:TerC family protein [Candidatus Limnocylindrales bacterium]